MDRVVEIVLRGGWAELYHTPLQILRIQLNIPRTMNTESEPDSYQTKFPISKVCLNITKPIENGNDVQTTPGPTHSDRICTIQRFISKYTKRASNLLSTELRSGTVCIDRKGYVEQQKRS